MPYLANDEDQKRRDELAAQAGGTNVSGVSNTVNQSATTPQKASQKSGSFTNLNSYLDANQDNAETLGNTVAGNIAGQGDTTRTGIQNSTNEFNEMADRGTIKNLSSAKDDAAQAVQGARTGVYGSSLGDDQVDRFKEVSNASYKGPNDLAASKYYGDTSKNLEKAKGYQGAAQSDEGRFGLLQEMFNRPTYSQGQKNLDNLLITGNQKAKSAIKGAGDSLSDLQGSFDSARGGAASLAGNRTSQSNDARMYAQNSLNQNRNERSSEVDQDLANQNTNWKNEYNQYNDLLSNYKGGELELNQAQADRLGVGGASGQGVYNMLNGVAGSNYLDQKAFDANKVVKKDQYSQLAALDKLGSQFGSANQSKFNAGIDQAETLNAQNAFDASRFGSGQKQATTNFDDYSGKTNFSGEGSGKQTYKDGGWDGNNKHDVYADTTISANLKDYLNNGNFTFNNENRTASRAGIGPDGITTGNKYADLATRPGGMLVDSVADGVGSLFGRKTSTSKEAGARRNAETESNDIAQGNYFKNLNSLLDNQGYKNRIKIKG